AAIQFAWVPGPQPVVRSHVEEQPATSHRALERGRVTKIAGCHLHVEPFDAAAGTNQCANRIATLPQHASDVRSEVSGSAGEQHGLHAGLAGRLTIGRRLTTCPTAPGSSFSSVVSMPPSSNYR